ncbi:hypothetical protein J6P04_02890 [bacterium]|nr:hypothetical protein [bacterium]
MQSYITKNQIDYYAFNNNVANYFDATNGLKYCSISLNNELVINPITVKDNNISWFYNYIYLNSKSNS